MKKFMLVYYGKVRAEEISKEEMKNTMDKWMAWFGSFQKQMVDGGNPFAADAMSVTANGIETISPEELPAKGYTIITTTDMAEATKIAKTCPVLEDDSEGAVHVYEALPI